jgi:hypothetical protein
MDFKHIRVITCVVNRPGFIEIQLKLMKKHFKFEYEFIVFNDAKDFPDVTNGNNLTIKTQIESVCSMNGIECINIPNDHHRNNKNAALRTADSFNYVLEYQRQHPGKYLVIDSDMFPIADYDIEKLENFSAAIVLQERNNIGAKYFWNGIFYFDMMKMKDTELLNWTPIPGCDVGGSMQTWLNKTTAKHLPSCDVIRISSEQYVGYGIYYMRHFWSLTWDETEYPENLQKPKLLDFLKNDERNQNNKFYCEIYDNVFLHYRNGANWDNVNENFYFDKHRELYRALKEALDID